MSHRPVSRNCEPNSGTYQRISGPDLDTWGFLTHPQPLPAERGLSAVALAGSEALQMLEADRVARGGRPDLAGCIAAAQSGEEAARKHLKNWSEREKVRRMLAAAMGKASLYAVEREFDGMLATGAELEKERSMYGSLEELRDMDLADMAVYSGGEEDLESEDYTPRRRVAAVELDGKVVAIDGRFIRGDWCFDPQRECERLARCQSSRVVTHGPGGFQAVPRTCGSRLCPHCVARNADEWEQEVTPTAVAVAVSELGCSFAHVSLTLEIPVYGDKPVHLTGHERARGYHAQEYSDLDDDVATAHTVGSSSLRELDVRLRQAFRDLRNGRGTAGRAAKRWWDEHVIGYVYGVDLTARKETERQDGSMSYVPRWHPHLHIFLMLRPEVDVVHEERFTHGQWRPHAGGQWWDDLVHHWSQAAGPDVEVSPDAQWSSPIDGTAEDIQRMIKEVAKYPIKTAALTDAQALEFCSYMKGLKRKFRGGNLHHSSRLGMAINAVVRAELDRELLANVEPLLESWGSETHEAAEEVVFARWAEHPHGDKWDITRWELAFVSVVAASRMPGEPVEPTSMVMVKEDDREPQGEANEFAWVYQEWHAGIDTALVGWWRPVEAREVGRWMRDDGPDMPRSLAFREKGKDGLARVTRHYTVELWDDIRRWRPPDRQCGNALRRADNSEER